MQLHFQIVKTVVEPPLVAGFLIILPNHSSNVVRLRDVIQVPFLHRSVAVFAVEHAEPTVSGPVVIVSPMLPSVVERRRASITVVNRHPFFGFVAAVLFPFVYVISSAYGRYVVPCVIVFIVAEIPAVPDEVHGVFMGLHFVTTVEFLMELEGEVVRLGHWHLEPDIAPDHPENIPIHIQLLPDLLELADGGVFQAGRSRSGSCHFNLTLILNV